MRFWDRIVKNHAGSLDLYQIVRMWFSTGSWNIYKMYAEISDFWSKARNSYKHLQGKCIILALFIADCRKRILEVRRPVSRPLPGYVMKLFFELTFNEKWKPQRPEKKFSNAISTSQSREKKKVSGYTFRRKVNSHYHQKLMEEIQTIGSFLYCNIPQGNKQLLHIIFSLLSNSTLISLFFSRFIMELNAYWTLENDVCLFKSSMTLNV